MKRKICLLLLFTSVMKLAVANERDTSAPDTPHNVRIIKCDDRRALVGWNPASKDDIPVRLYRIQYSTSIQSDVWYDAQTIGAKEQEVSIQLPADCEVRIRVHAYNAKGMSPPGEAKEKCVVAEARPDRNPTDVVGKGTTPNNMVISWTPMSLIDHNGPDFHYVVKWRRRGSDRHWQKFRVSHPVSSFGVDDLPSYTAHDIIVQAWNAIGAAVMVPRKVVGYSGEDIPEVTPESFQLADRSSGNDNQQVDAEKSVVFEWKSVNTSEDVIHGEFRGYRIFLIDRQNPRRTWQTDVLVPRRKKDQADSEMVVGIVGNLVPATDYQAYATVINNRFIGPPSQRVDFSTRETAPGAVGNLHVVRSAHDSVIVAWYPPKAPNGRILGYTYSYTQVLGFALGEGVDGEDMLSSMANHVQLRHLAPNTTYRIYVYAHTAAGRGPAAQVDVTLKLPTPPVEIVDSGERSASPAVVRPTLSMEYLAEQGSQSLEAVRSLAVKTYPSILTLLILTSLRYVT